MNIVIPLKSMSDASTHLRCRPDLRAGSEVRERFSALLLPVRGTPSPKGVIDFPAMIQPKATIVIKS
jgi:hypothetical protein